MDFTKPSRAVSGRPSGDEVAAYARPDIDRVEGDDAVGALVAQRRQTVLLVESLDEAAVEGLTYAPGKWTLKEVLGHLADDERIFAYRALCIARADARPLSSFDEKAYVESAGFEARPLASLLAEYRAVRHGTIALLGGLPAAAWLRRGVVSDYTASVRGLAFHIAGHELRHLRAIREKYLRWSTAGDPLGYSGPMAALPPSPPQRRNEQHRCAHCGSRFEVWHRADPLDPHVAVEVRCPCCSAATSVSLPRGAEKDLRVENLPGTEPETGGGD